MCMKASQLWWKCPKCGNKVRFGYELITLFDRDNGEAWFESESGVPFYVVKCETEGCNARWNFRISSMYED